MSHMHASIHHKEKEVIRLDKVFRNTVRLAAYSRATIRQRHLCNTSVNETQMLLDWPPVRCQTALHVSKPSEWTSIEKQR
jgi:hypothetical protein